MFEVIKKQLIVFSVCFIFSFIICFFYPVKKDLYLGIKNFFNSKTVVDINSIITINYKRVPENYKEFIVSGSNPILAINFNNKYIENIKINFKDKLQESLQLKIYMEKENIDADNELIKIEDIEILQDKLSYNAKINTFFKSLFFIVGEKIGDKFIVDNITYNENYKYYWNKIFHYNYLKQLKTKSYWLNVLKLFGLFMLLVISFIVGEKIYRKNV